MEIEYTPEAIKDRDYWLKTGNKSVQKKITALIEAILKHPYEGIGKPEGLKYKLSGKWSRKINEVDRLVYEIKEGEILLISRLKGHY